MRMLWWIIVIMTILATPTTVLRGMRLLLAASDTRPGSEAQLWTWAVETGFCIFFISLGLKIISDKIEARRDSSPPPSDNENSGQS